MDLEKYADKVAPDALENAKRLLSLPEVVARVNGNIVDEVLLQGGTKMRIDKQGSLFVAKKREPTLARSDEELGELIKPHLVAAEKQSEGRTIIFIGGHSGSGKSLAINLIGRVSDDLGLSTKPAVLSSDSTYRTKRGDPLREAKNLPRELFFAMRLEPEEVVRAIVDLALRTRELIFVSCSEIYDRETRTVKPGKIVLPPSNVLIVDGVRSVELGEKMKLAYPDAHIVTVGLYDGDDERQIKTVMGRDVARGARTPEDAYAFRVAESIHQIPFHEEVLPFADYIRIAPDRFKQSVYIQCAFAEYISNGQIHLD